MREILLEQLHIRMRWLSTTAPPGAASPVTQLLDQLAAAEKEMLLSARQPPSHSDAGAAGGDVSSKPSGDPATG